MFDGGRYRTYTTRDGLPSLSITKLCRDQHGTLWIVTKDAGLSRLKDGKFTVFPLEGLLSSDIVAAHEDRAGDVWVATLSGRLARWHDNKWTMSALYQPLDLRLSAESSRENRTLLRQKPSLNDLTATERRVLKLIAENKTSRQIGDELFISYRTVENHRANICNKLELHGSNALLKFALQHKSQLT